MSTGYLPYEAHKGVYELLFEASVVQTSLPIHPTYCPMVSANLPKS